ncbi:MAG: Ni/Fe hydrogenase subunit alpha [FCB group bacterium]|nr:Ni/Fe hydrogenase subunit alpha [FCB group bacterium]
MSRNLHLNIKHLTRVEGHGNIVVNVTDGRLERCELEIVEPPRFFEALLKGRHFQEAAIITSRICGICSLGHQITSLKATEAALGLEISEQTRLLRQLLIDGATIQSHILHAYFLAAPDFFGKPNAFKLLTTHKDVVLRALRLKRLANDIGDIVSGRAVHPITPVPGGFTRLPTETELNALLKKLIETGRPDMQATVDTFSTVLDDIPDFTRETEYISLKNADTYAFYDGDLFSSDTGSATVDQYRDWTREFVVPHSTSKHCRHTRDSFMVGALARWNNNHEQMLPAAREAAQTLGLKSSCHNPYMNTVAQVVESDHCLEEAIAIIDLLLTRGLKPEKPNQQPTRYGRGIGATEVPRGLLYHDYTYNRQGNIVAANCVIPTGQNLANIDADMKKRVPEILDQPRETIQKELEMLVRAYDPCISCSVHAIQVTFTGGAPPA